MKKRNLILITYYSTTGNAKLKDLDTGQEIYIMNYNEKIKRRMFQ